MFLEGEEVRKGSWREKRREERWKKDEEKKKEKRKKKSERSPFTFRYDLVCTLGGTPPSLIRLMKIPQLFLGRQNSKIRNFFSPYSKE